MKIYFASKLRAGGEDGLRLNQELVDKLRRRGHKVFYPGEAGIIDDCDVWSFHTERDERAFDLGHDWHKAGVLPYRGAWKTLWDKDLTAMKMADLCLVYVPKDGRIGHGVCFELGFMLALQKVCIGYAPLGSDPGISIYRPMITWYDDWVKLVNDIDDSEVWQDWRDDNE